MRVGASEGETLTVSEVCQVLRICRDSAYSMIRRGEIRAIRIGNKFVILRSELDRILQGGRS
jgi:excisionase family DNA binding protein